MASLHVMWVSSYKGSYGMLVACGICSLLEGIIWVPCQGPPGVSSLHHQISPCACTQWLVHSTAWRLVSICLQVLGRCSMHPEIFPLPGANYQNLISYFNDWTVLFANNYCKTNTVNIRSWLFKRDFEFPRDGLNNTRLVLAYCLCYSNCSY